ncbi:uncharacterized protein LOC109706771 [Ananas comosus]|uniref:Uncharacterized protein LOC109706771 n=1 Tax=Ananas comosus TaxID=4615 RepID=A0A6P5EIT8_ANACO|nr:uncharacterized protein LOC109706771 [Ananas comosus]
MSVAFTRLSHFLWGKKDHEKTTNTSLPDFPSGYREPDSVKFSSVNGPRAQSSSRRIKKNWQRQEEQIDREFDVVIVPSDGGCMSGWESDDSDGSDWSVGWLEPHAHEFQCETESDSSFAVLVPCYRRGIGKPEKSVKIRSLGASNLSEGKSFIEQWLSSLQNS